MTTHVPRPTYSPEEIRALYPKHLELRQVQVILRHGERTPTKARFQNAGLPSNWPYCTAARQLTDAIMSSSNTKQWDSINFARQLESFGKDDMPVAAVGPKGEYDSICLPGELTDKGRETTLALGNRLRHLYVDQLQFMPSLLPSNEMIYLRSTPVPRAKESVQQAYWGMYPPTSRAPGLSKPIIITRPFSEETLFPNDGACQRYSELSRLFEARTAGRWNDSEEMKYLTKKIGKWMSPASPQVKVDGRPRLSGIMDTVNATLAHGPETRLPGEFYDAKVRSIIDKVANEEWYSGFRESQEYRKLGIGALAGDIVSRMVEHARGDDVKGSGPRPEGERAGRSGKDIRFALSGAHDTTLAAFLASVGAFEDEGWPPFTSHIAWELFKSGGPVPSNRPPPSDSATSGAEPPQRGWFSSLFGYGKTAPRGESAAEAYTTVRKPLDQQTAAERAPLKDYYVRVRFNDRVKALPGCKAPGKHLEGDESFCTLEAFKEIVDAFTPRSWKAECGMNLGKGVLDADMSK